MNAERYPESEHFSEGFTYRVVFTNYVKCFTSRFQSILAWAMCKLTTLNPKKLYTSYESEEPVHIIAPALQYLMTQSATLFLNLV